MKWKERQIVDDTNVDELIMDTEDGFPGKAQLLQKLQPGEFHKETIYIGGIKEMERYIKGLQKAGLDIGKGDAAFGYRMPLPEKNKPRELIIFRRY